MINFRVLTWREIDELARTLFSLIKNDSYRPDIIIGISRGGTIPARLLSDMFEADGPLKGDKQTIQALSTMQVKFYTGIAETHASPVVAQDVGVNIYNQFILLVDDLADSGESIRCALEYLNLKRPKEVRVATLIVKPWSKITPEYFVEEATEWVVFPHEYYEFMKERTISERYDRIQAWSTFTGLGIPDSSVNFFVENFL
ncbi:MAG: phosphoribosyltransferase [Candidatus Heimdallarchaeota archaeon]